MQHVLARKNVQSTKFEAAEMIVDPWNQQINRQRCRLIQCEQDGDTVRLVSFWKRKCLVIKTFSIK